MMFGKKKAEENVSSQNFGPGEEKREERPCEKDDRCLHGMDVIHKIVSMVADDVFRNDADALYEIGRKGLDEEMKMKIPEGKKIWNTNPDIARSVEALGLPKANTESVLQLLTSIADGGVWGMMMVVVLWKDLILPMEGILKPVEKGMAAPEEAPHAEDLHE